MSQKEKFVGLGMLCASVGLFYVAIDLWVCGSDTACQQDSKIAKAITIDYETQADDWSGRAKPDFYINSPGLNVTFPPPPQTGDDGGSDGH